MPFSVVAGANVGVFVLLSSVSVWNNWILCATRLHGQTLLLADVAELTACWIDFCTELISFTLSLASVMDYCHSSQSTAGRLPRSAQVGAAYSPQLSFTLSCRACLCICFFLRVMSKVEVNNLSKNGELVGSTCLLSPSQTVVPFHSVIVFCLFIPISLLLSGFEAHTQGGVCEGGWGGCVVFSLAVDVYQSFPSLYHISGLALPYGSLGSLTRLAVLSYLRIAVLCGLDCRCLWISPLLCNGFSSRMTTSLSRMEPCITAISVACCINWQNKTLNQNFCWTSWTGAAFPNCNARMCKETHLMCSVK